MNSIIRTAFGSASKSRIGSVLGRAWVLALMLVMGVPATVFAHPGDHTHSRLEHIFTNPDHLLWVLAILAVGVLAFRPWRWLRARPRD